MKCKTCTHFQSNESFCKLKEQTSNGKNNACEKYKKGADLYD